MDSIKDYIKEKCADMLQHATTLDFGRNSGSREVMNSYYGAIIRKCVEMTNRIKQSAIEEGCEFGIDKGILDMVKVNVEYINNVTHITFDHLLPMRTKGYTLNERDTIHRVYLSPLSGSFRNERVVRYDSKVVMCVIHTFAEGSVIIDHDNFDLKPIKDAISSFCLIDDSVVYVAEYHDYRVGEQNQTDIYLVPDEEFVSFMQGGMK